MSDFISEHFLLKTPTARRLFRECAEQAPIIDFHCHLDATELAADRSFSNVAQLWVTSDPYKHRAMRMAGVPEQSITGSATDEEKFHHWAATVPLTLANPLFDWSALELKRTFDVATPLNAETAGDIWRQCNARLREPEFTARGLLTRRKVECVCTSDRLLDDLASHAALKRSDFATRVLPSLRGDDLVAVHSPDYAAWVQKLGAMTGVRIATFGDFSSAFERRLDAFAELGCKLADHALDEFRYETVTDAEVASLFDQKLAGATLTTVEGRRLVSGLLRHAGVLYGRRGWILQLHLGAQRRTSSRLRALAGAAGGFATVGNPVDVPSVCALLDDLEKNGALPRTILYPLNSADFAALAVLGGSFSEDGVRGKVQLGPAWWFNDHAQGMRTQLEAIANHGLLSVFIGMTTDSRSLLSMNRHEYFRRVLCDWLGDKVSAGALPDDFEQLGRLVQAIVSDNARHALGLSIPKS